MSMNPQECLKKLREIPNIGPSMAADLLSLGIESPGALRGRDPIELYRRLEALTGVKQDPCVLDTFMAAVHFAETGERRTWWSFTAERKALMQADQGRGAGAATAAVPDFVNHADPSEHPES